MYAMVVRGTNSGILDDDEMRNLFIYETPHPAHLAFARSIDCFVPDKSCISKPKILNMLSMNIFYLRLARTPVLTRYAIEKAANDYEVPIEFRPPNEPDIVLYEGWRQMGLSQYFPNSFNVLINGDWYPLIFYKNKKMMEYYEYMDLIITVSEYNKNHLPECVQDRVRIIHPSLSMRSFGRAGGVDCVFIGNVHERVKRVDLSIKLFKKAFGNDHRVCFHIIGPGSRKSGRYGNIYYWGKMPHTEIKKILLGSKFYIHWGDGDPHPVTVMEAMANGVIPITSPKIGNHYLTDLVLEGVGDCETMDDAVKVMRQIDHDNDLCEELRSKCISFSEGYEPERTMENFRFCVEYSYNKWLEYQ